MAMDNVTGEFIQNVSEEIPGVLDNIDLASELIPVDNLFLKALIVTLMFFIFAFIIKYLFSVILKRLVRGTKTEIDDKIVESAKFPTLALVTLLGLFLAGRILGIHTEYDDYTKLFVSVVMFFGFLVFMNVVSIIFHGLKDRMQDRSIKLFDKTIFPFTDRLIKILIFAVYLFILFDLWKIDITPLLASAGIAGIAIAFAAQDTIANIFGGFSMFADKTFEIGDYIVIDDKERGEVVDIGMRSTKIKTRDNIIVIVPNSVLAKAKIVNETGDDPRMRVRIPLEVSYGENLEKIEKVLLETAKKADYLEKDPAPVVSFREFGSYSIKVQVIFWIKEPQYKGPYTNLMIKDIYNAFKKNKISFPYPKQDIYLNKR